MVAAVLDGGAIHVDKNGGAQGSYDVNAVQLSQGDPGTIEIAAVQRKDIQRLIGTGQVQLVEDYLAGAVWQQGAPEIGGALQIALRLRKINGCPYNQETVGISHGVVRDRAAGIYHRVAAGVGACGDVDISVYYKRWIRIGGR